MPCDAMRATRSAVAIRPHFGCLFGESALPGRFDNDRVATGLRAARLRTHRTALPALSLLQSQT